MLFPTMVSKMQSADIDNIVAFTGLLQRNIWVSENLAGADDFFHPDSELFLDNDFATYVIYSCKQINRK